MVKKILIFFLLTCSLYYISNGAHVQAETVKERVQCMGEDAQRCVECDYCGYCFSKDDVPSDWKDCAKCMYPDVFAEVIDDIDKLKNDDAKRNLTVHIFGQERGGIPRAPKPKAGRYYTQLGCFTTNSDDYFDAFSGGSGAGGPVSQLLNVLFSVSGVLAFFYLVYGAFLVATSRAEPEKLQRGRLVIIGAIVGLIFSLSSVLIMNLISNQILRIPGLGADVVPVSIKSSESDPNKGELTLSPKKVDFEIAEFHVRKGQATCATGMNTINPNDVDRAKVIICYPSNGQGFKGESPMTVLTVSKDIEITKIVLDGKIEMQGPF